MSEFTKSEASRQLISFEGMRFGNTAPTDIDGLIEYHNKGLIVFEVKYDLTPIPLGQRLAIERIVDAYRKSGKIAVAFLCRHWIKDPSEDVVLKDTQVYETYWNGQWQQDCGSAEQRAQDFIDYIERN